MIRYYNLSGIFSSETQGNLGLSSVIMDSRRERKREKIWEEKGGEREFKDMVVLLAA